MKESFHERCEIQLTKPNWKWYIGNVNIFNDWNKNGIADKLHNVLRLRQAVICDVVSKRAIQRIKTQGKSTKNISWVIIGTLLDVTEL